MDIWDEVSSLKNELRRVQFDQTTAASEQLRTLRNELERAFNENRQGTELMKTTIMYMLQEHSVMIEERMKD